VPIDIVVRHSVCACGCVCVYTCWLVRCMKAVGIRSFVHIDVVVRFIVYTCECV
jgi:predicted MarR family transcription regulator